MSRRLTTPEPLSPSHHLDRFGCGEARLDEWLKRRALANQYSGASRTFVVADGDGQVCGYYALAAGAVAHGAVTGAIRRNMPNPVPVMMLVRLAVDLQSQGTSLGEALLQESVERVVGVSHQVGVRALVVHAINERAGQFYEHYGFKRSPLDPLMLMLRFSAAPDSK